MLKISPVTALASMWQTAGYYNILNSFFTTTQQSKWQLQIWHAFKSQV